MALGPFVAVGTAQSEAFEFLLNDCLAVEVAKILRLDVPAYPASVVTNNDLENVFRVYARIVQSNNVVTGPKV